MNRIFILFIVLMSFGCSAGTLTKQQTDTEQLVIINSNQNGNGPDISIEFNKGKSFYYPLMAVWIEDTAGKYLQTLFVPKSIATGIFKFGKQQGNKWLPAPKRAPQTLPYWSHKRGIIASDGLFMPEPGNPVADAYSGETPVSGFILNSKADNKLPVVFRVLLEINQNWDWNEYWTNDKFPGDDNYMMSCQPALVYETEINTDRPANEYLMKPIGHSHYSGKTGDLFEDISTLTTALHIADSIIVKIR